MLRGGIVATAAAVGLSLYFSLSRGSRSSVLRIDFLSSTYQAWTASRRFLLSLSLSLSLILSLTVLSLLKRQ
jgi:hypothetical protein